MVLPVYQIQQGLAPLYTFGEATSSTKPNTPTGERFWCGKEPVPLGFARHLYVCRAPKFICFMRLEEAVMKVGAAGSFHCQLSSASGQPGSLSHERKKPVCNTEVLCPNFFFTPYRLLVKFEDSLVAYKLLPEIIALIIIMTNVYTVVGGKGHHHLGNHYFSSHKPHNNCPSLPPTE